jgi:hypothetical protein
MAFPGKHLGTASIVALIWCVTVGPSIAQSHVPDLSGVWARDAHSFPKPYRTNGEITDGYDNEYLLPWVVELLNRDALVQASSRTVASPHSICYPEGIPYAFGGTQVQILQTPDEITILFGDTNQWRTIRLNDSHPDDVEPSWYGDSVGHFEGDTLVVDTVGLAVNPQSGSMGGAGSMGGFGTPHTEQLHVVERWRFLREGEVTIAPPARNDSFDAAAVVQDGKIMRLTFTSEDRLAYRKPWTVTLDYLELDARLREFACAENSRFWDLEPLIPISTTPDF